MRAITFDEVSIWTLRDICTLGKEPALANTGQSVGLGMYCRTAVVTLGIVVEEMEFKASSGSERRMVGGRPQVEVRLELVPMGCGIDS